MGRRRKKKKLTLQLHQEIWHSIASIVLILLGLLLMVSFSGQGLLLSAIQQKSSYYFGFASILLPFLFISAGLMLTKLNWRITKPNVLLGSVLLFISVLAISKAGSVGSEIFLNISTLIQPLGAYLVFVCIGLVGFLIMTESSFEDILRWLVAMPKLLPSFGKKVSETKLAGAEHVAPAAIPERKMKVRGRNKDVSATETQAATEQVKVNKASKKKEEKAKEKSKPASAQPVVANTPGQEKGVYRLPSVDLLESQVGGEADRGDINKNAVIIEDTLSSFSISAQVVEVNLGPAVTQYALQINIGTKLSKITSLQNDLALALAAPTGQIRIEAPIPGKSLVGIEVPNKTPEMVGLRNMLTSKAMKKDPSKTLIGLGLDVSGEHVVADISKMPHVLIAGATGSGKSVAVNSFITSILYRATPDEVKFIMVDPKRVELTPYNGIPHLLTPVIVEPEKVVAALEWAVNEMNKRYKLLSEVGVKNIESYNDLSGFQALPYLVIIIDELADIMLFAPSKVEEAITRLAQMARAVGIHLVLATQRPSVDIITGLIKANIPCRIAFNVTSAIDSRVILDSPGAEKLLGKGDMLYVSRDGRQKRIQGTYLSDKEVHRTIEMLKNTGIEPEYAEEVTTKFAPKTVVGIDGTPDEVDEKFEEAVRIVVSSDKASASLLQRRLSVGYARAARILDQLHAAGVVSEAQGSKARDVLIDDADSYLS